MAFYTNLVVFATIETMSNKKEEKNFTNTQSRILNIYIYIIEEYMHFLVDMKYDYLYHAIFNLLKKNTHTHTYIYNMIKLLYYS